MALDKHRELINVKIAKLGILIPKRGKGND
jgi:hypothetical protein